MLRRCTRRWLDGRCRVAGMRPEDCARCIVRDEGRVVEVDDSHESFPRPGLGDRVAAGLAAVGITEDRVSHALGVKDCGCKRRRKALNRLGQSMGLTDSAPGVKNAVDTP